MLPFDLHVLGLPPAFNLSHDQTLQFKIIRGFNLKPQNLAQLRVIHSNFETSYLQLINGCHQPESLQAPTRIAWSLLLKQLQRAGRLDLFPSLPPFGFRFRGRALYRPLKSLQAFFSSLRLPFRPASQRRRKSCAFYRIQIQCQQLYSTFERFFPGAVRLRVLDHHQPAGPESA